MVNDWCSLTLAQLQRIASELHEALAGRTADEMAVRVVPTANPVGWLAWHLTRSHDRNLSEIAGVPQRWIDEGWHERFGMAADPNETGFGHTAEQVATFRHVDGDTLLAYHASVIDTANAYLSGAPPDDLARVAPSPTLGTAHTVQQRLIGVLNEGFQHLGQIRLTYRGQAPGQEAGPSRSWPDYAFGASLTSLAAAL